MANENEVIIPDEKDEEEEEVDDLEPKDDEEEEGDEEEGEESDESDESEEDDEEEKEPQPKSKKHAPETPEAKHARLKRELAQQEKRMGLNKGKPAAPKADEPQLSPKDLFALVKADVHEDDFNEVTDFAAFKKISIPEALKTTALKTILAEKSEERATAAATNVTTTKRGTNKLGSDILLQKARKGEMPDNDADLTRMIKARKGIKN